MKLLKKIGDLFGGNLIETIADTVDRFVTTKEEKEQLKIELKNIIFEQKAKAFEMEIQDRESARDMYEKDNSLQKIFSLVFLVAYIALTGALLYMVFFTDKSYKEFEISLISTLFGAMSVKVSTITDFLFGGSMEKKPEPKMDIS